MAIAFDAHAEADSGASVSSLSYAHTCSGVNRFLLVSIENANAAGDIVTGVTYAGVSMSRVNTFALSTLGQGYVYQLAAPSLGSNNIVISTSTTTTLAARSASYTGVIQVSPVDNSTTSTTLSTSTTFTTTMAVVDKVWVYLFAMSDHGVLSGSGTAFFRGGGSATNIADFDSNAAATPAGSWSMTATSSSGLSSWGTSMVSFKPAATGSDIQGGFFTKMVT